MIKSSPQQLALDLLDRSICSVQVAAVVFDNHGIFGWGWNSMGKDGYGEHAECSAIRRCNRNRLGGSSIVVVGRRKRNTRHGRLFKVPHVVVTFPCTDCLRRLQKVGIQTVILQDKIGVWFKVRI